MKDYPNAINNLDPNTGAAPQLQGTGSWELIGTCDKLEGHSDTANFIVTNGGESAITNFKVQVQVFRGGPYIDYLIDANWLVPDNNMLLETPVSTTGAGGSSLVMIRTGPIHGLKFWAKGPANTPLTIQGTVG